MSLGAVTESVSSDLVTMNNYVQLPLSASALRCDPSRESRTYSSETHCHTTNRKWTRFAEKGGIGKAIGKVDKLAEPESGQLMFMEAETLIVLAPLGRRRLRCTIDTVLNVDCMQNLVSILVHAKAWLACSGKLMQFVPQARSHRH